MGIDIYIYFFSFFDKLLFIVCLSSLVFALLSSTCHLSCTFPCPHKPRFPRTSQNPDLINFAALSLLFYVIMCSSTQFLLYCITCQTVSYKVQLSRNTQMVDLMDLKSVQNSELSNFIHQTDLAFRLSKLFYGQRMKKFGQRLQHKFFFFIKKSDQWFILDNNIKKLYYMCFCELDAFFS